MTIAYRCVKADDARKAFNGEGARLWGGRWNRKGTAVVSVAESLALASLEKFVQLGDEGRNLKFVYIKVEIPDDVKIEQLPVLPTDWRSTPPSDSTQSAGTAWVEGNTSTVLKIPSALVTIEFNYMLNIAHPDFKKIKIYEPVDFSFDPRMWKV